MRWRRPALLAALAAAALSVRRAASRLVASPPSETTFRHALTFWHLTDTHLNLWHAADGDVRDMCRSNASEPARKPGMFGHFNCDPSRELLRLALERMQKVAPHPDLILLGGDVFGHVPAVHEGATAISESQRSQSELIATFFPRTPVLPVLGNHDTWPYFISGSEAIAARKLLAEIYFRSKGDDSRRAQNELRTQGYFIFKLAQWGVWVIGLETNMLSIADAHDAAQEQLRWLELMLEDASLRDVQVLILGHIAPGASHCDWDSMASTGWSGGGWTAPSQQAFYRVLRRWGRVVTAGFFGHLHTPSVRLLDANLIYQQADVRHGPRSATQHFDHGREDESHKAGPMPVLYLSPSVTSRNPTPHTPAVRHYTLTPVDVPTFVNGISTTADSSRSLRPALEVSGILDQEFDIESSNLARQPVWRSRSVKSDQNLSSFSFHGWARWVQSILVDQQFDRYMTAQRCADEVESNYAKCKASVVCAMIELEPRGYSKCLRSVRRHAFAPVGWQEAKKRSP